MRGWNGSMAAGGMMPNMGAGSMAPGGMMSNIGTGNMAPGGMIPNMGRKPFFKGAGRHICDYSWTRPIPQPMSRHRGSRVLENMKTMSKMTPGRKPGRPTNVKQISSKSYNIFSKNDLELALELPQVTPKTPKDRNKKKHKKRKTNVKNMASTSPNTIPKNVTI